ncbi:unnamed protein product [Merluccius merluccius]
MASGRARAAALCVSASLSFIFIFITGADFIRFVSFRAIYRNITGDSSSCRDDVSWRDALGDGAVLGPLAVDAGLLALFVAQHSLLAWAPVKRVYQSCLGVLSRAAYCSSTALALQILMRFWQPVHSAPCLWAVRDAPWSLWLPVLCFALHFLCWAVMCSILLIFDYPELLGLKQVYYDLLGLGDPLSSKSPRAQRLFSHLRHPVCVELCVVLWFLPALPLDRLLLAGSLTAYLALAHSLDTEDLAYLAAQFNRKLQLFAVPHGGGGGGGGGPQDSGDPKAE